MTLSPVVPELSICGPLWRTTVTSSEKWHHYNTNSLPACQYLASWLRSGEWRGGMPHDSMTRDIGFYNISYV